MELKTLCKCLQKNFPVGGKDLKVKKEEIIPIRGNVQRLFGRRKLGKFQKLEEVSSGAEQITEKVTF